MSPRFITTLTLVLCSTAAANVFASGFEFPSNGTAALSRGGAFTAKADDLSAIELNPAGLLALKGTYIYLGNNISMANYEHTPLVASYATYPDSDPTVPAFVDYSDFLGFVKGKTLKNNAPPQYLGPLAGVSTDFGLQDWRFALGVFGPSANAVTDYPKDGPQRYTLVSTDVKLAWYTASVAWKPLDTLRLGLSLHWADLMQARLALVVSGAWNGLEITQLAAPRYDVLAKVDVADRFGLAATLGAIWQPLPWLEIGASFKGPPVEFEAEGNTSLEFQGDKMATMYASGIATGGAEGLVAFSNSGKATTKVPTTMKFNYPMVGRLGVRYVEREGSTPDSKEVFDIEADVVWEGWSVLERYEFQMDGYFMIVGDGVAGAQKMVLRPVKVERKYKDTWSFRLGGQYALLDFLTLRAGTYYETGSVPEAYSNLDFAGFERFGLALGVGLDFSPFTVSLGYSHVFQPQRDVTPEETKVYRNYPLQLSQPIQEDYKVGAGTFTTSFDIFSVALSYTL